VLCIKCAECRDKTEIKDHECPFRILVTLIEGGQYLGSLKGPLPAEALKLISTIQQGFVGEARYVYAATQTQLCNIPSLR